MTHKIKVQMFGNFRMDYNGAPFVAEKMHKESQFNRMMQALIHYSECGVAKDKLEEIVIGERDIDAPHTALRVIVYKTKQKLAQLGLPGKDLIYLEGGIYYWTPDIEIEEDAAEFEKLYNEACALEKQMPQEPESAETVCDERIKEIEDNMLELYVKALYLYKGEFLAAYTGETWIAQEARRYHIMFEKIINEAAYILRKRKQFKRLEKLGVYAAKVDPLKRTLTKVRKSEEKIKNLSDEELSALTEQFKSRYSDGESLESLMPEAFAAICEADYRVLGKRPYDVQILAAAALHGGYLAEMNTGEGKTLSATMPLYLNALTGKSCMLVTTNEYLAREMVQRWRGLQFHGS